MTIFFVEIQIIPKGLHSSSDLDMDMDSLKKSLHTIMSKWDQDRSLQEYHGTQKSQNQLAKIWHNKYTIKKQTYLQNWWKDERKTGQEADIEGPADISGKYCTDNLLPPYTTLLNLTTIQCLQRSKLVAGHIGVNNTRAEIHMWFDNHHEKCSKKLVSDVVVVFSIS